MPFRSKAQQRYMFAAEARGELKPGTAREWAHATPDIKKLPEHVDDETKKKRKKGVKEALDKYALNLSEINPHVLGAVLGGGAGALIAPEDHRLEGAAVGAGLGGALGVHHWAPKPRPPKQLIHTTNPEPEVLFPAVYNEHPIKDVNKLGMWQALEKFAAFTPAFIRTIARDGDVEIDHPEFKEKCRGLTGEAHLDKMNSGQLGQVAKMLWSKK